MLRVELAVPAGHAGEAFAERCFAELEEAVRAARSYRGKILSFDADANYRGRSTGIMVHRLPLIDREQVILREQTLGLLDRNVLQFVGSREALRRLGQSTRKGILLYGPPGTGKTHTIRYLAANLPDHTTLIITAEQMAWLGAYMGLARLLQPAMVVIEDVDLIARDRNEMGGPCEELLLNKLLNEMDGLKEDADILFVLTTNRPEELESALAGRPGRIDQAIEVSLPDDIGRAKLVRLYGKGLPLSAAVVDEAGRRTEGVSARLHQGADAADRAKRDRARRRSLRHIDRHRRSAERHAVRRRKAQCKIARRRAGDGRGIERTGCKFPVSAYSSSAPRRSGIRSHMVTRSTT